MEKNSITILTPIQERVLDIFFSVPLLRQHFYLTGGTALSEFYLHHRYSDDLDFFTHSMEIDIAQRLIEDALSENSVSFQKQTSSATFRRYLLDGELQIDLVREYDFRVGIPQLHRNYMVDTPQNIVINKIVALYGRLDAKDYVDLFFLSKYLPEFKIMELIKIGQNKDGGLEAFQWVKVTSDVDTLSILPRMIVPVKMSQIKSFFHKLHEEIILALTPG